MKPTNRNTRLPLQTVLALVCLLICIASPLTTFSQTTDRPPGISQKGNPLEELYIITDRDIYISGEDVYLKVYCLNRQKRKPSGLSKVAYVTLIDKTSMPIVRVKIWLNGRSGSGKLTLPDTLSTGNYIINACTHLMQNFSPEMFAARMISAINPLPNTELNEMHPQGSISADAVNNVTEADRQPEDKEAADSMAGWNIQTDRTTYQPREKVRITVSAFGNDGKPLVSDIVLSVVRAIAYDGMNRDIPAGLSENPGSRRD